MNDSLEFWLVEQYVDLGNESFWHEKGRILRNRFHTDGKLSMDCHRIGERDVLKHGGRYRIRVTKEETVKVWHKREMEDSHEESDWDSGEWL